MDETEKKRSSANRSDINYLEGSIDSRIYYDEEDDPCIPNAKPGALKDHEKCTKPYIKVRHYPDLPIGDQERDGILTDRLVEVCSCCLEETAVPGKYALTRCVLERKGLKCIEVLGYHQFLKHVDLSRNLLESVEVLGKLPFLQHLDVSHNLLTELVEFKAPLNLTYLNYSFNLVEEMVDLEDFWCLVYLDLSHNLIIRIFGLDTLKYLSHLDLSYNKIKCLENLSNLKIQTLHLDFNNISSFECIGPTLLKLLHFSISNNSLRSLEFLNGLRNIESINFAKNDVQDMLELTHLKNMPFLTALDLHGNPVVEHEKFRSLCFSIIERLEELNGELISFEEKGKAKFTSTLSPDLEFGNMNYHNSPEIDSTVIPCFHKIVTMILLVGPMATKRTDLLKTILEAHPKFAKLAVSHTTRPITANEVNGQHYYFISENEFKAMLLDGRFLSCSHKYGFSYGLSYDELRKTSEEIGIQFINCDITSALQIKAKFWNCKLVLMLPKSETSHQNHLQKKFVTTPWLLEYLTKFLKDQIPSKSSEAKVQPPAPQASDYFEVSTNHHESNYNMLFEKPSPIIKYEITEEEAQKRKDQNVSFLYGSLQPTTTKTGEACSSASQTIDPGRHSHYPLSSISAATTGDGFRERDLGLRSASKAVLGDNSMTLTTVSRQTESGSGKKSRDISFALSHDHFDKKYHIMSSRNYLNTPGLLSSVSQEIKTEDEFILSVLLSKSDIIDSSSSSQIGSDFSRRLDVSENTVDQEKELLLRYFIESQMMRRRKYLNYYNNFPGLFYTMVSSDDLKDALPKLTEVLKSCVNMQKRHIFVTKTQCKNINVCSEMRDEKINVLLDQIR